MPLVDAWKSLPPEYQSRVNRIMATPKRCPGPTPRRFPTKGEALMQRGRNSTGELSQRTKALIKRCFDFWCSQIDASSQGMSLRCFLIFCREARVLSDQLEQHNLCEMFDGFCEEHRLAFEPFLTVLQLVADVVSAGELPSLLSEFILPHTAGVRIKFELKLLYSEEVQQVLELHRGALQLIYCNYSTGGLHPPALRSAGLYSAPVGTGNSCDLPGGSLDLEDMQRLGREVQLWPELGASEVAAAFKASSNGARLSYDGLCECIFRCTMLMLGERTPLDWVCNCLHQMLSSAYTQLAPTSIRSPLPAPSRVPSPLPSQSPVIQSPRAPDSEASLYPEHSTPLASTLAVSTHRDDAHRRMQSAYGVLSRLEPHLRVSEHQDPKQAELHAELLRARDTLVASMMTGSGSCELTGSSPGPRTPHVAVGDAGASTTPTDRMMSLQQIVNAKRERLQHSEPKSGMRTVQGVVSGSTLEGIRARLGGGPAPSSLAAQLNLAAPEPAAADASKLAAVEAIKDRLLRAQRGGTLSKDRLEELGDDTREAVSAGLVRSLLEGAVSEDTLEGVRCKMEAAQSKPGRVGLIAEIEALHDQRRSQGRAS